MQLCGKDGRYLNNATATASLDQCGIFQSYRTVTSLGHTPTLLRWSFRWLSVVDEQIHVTIHPELQCDLGMCVPVNSSVTEVVSYVYKAQIHLSFFA